MVTRDRIAHTSTALALALGVSLVTAPPPLRAETSPPLLAPFAAHYTAEWKSIAVGTSDLQLAPDSPPGRYVYTWTVSARGVFRMVYSHDVVQKSWLSIAQDHARPEKYHADDGTSNVDIDFDWSEGRARGTAQKKPVDVALSSGTQDVMSIQVEVMLDLRNGNLPKSFEILDNNQIKEFEYAEEGTAKLRTALGELDTVIVTSQRPGNDRVLRMWFAPSLGFIPVQAERYRGGKLEFAMRIKTLNR
jgi:Protein of unknown function (DUF3108)